MGGVGRRPKVASDHHPHAYARLMDAPEYATGFELNRVDCIEGRAACGEPFEIPPRSLDAAVPWGEHSAAIGLAQPYLSHLASTDERVAGDGEAELEAAYCAEQFAKRFAVDGGRVLYCGFPTRGSDGMGLRLCDATPDGGCSFLAFPVPMASPFQGRPFVGAYLDPRIPRGEGGGPDAGMMLVTRGEEGRGFWPAFRALGRVSCLWARRCDTLDEFAGTVAACGVHGEIDASVAEAAALALRGFAEAASERLRDGRLLRA